MSVFCKKKMLHFLRPDKPRICSNLYDSHISYQHFCNTRHGEAVKATVRDAAAKQEREMIILANLL